VVGVEAADEPGAMHFFAALELQVLLELQDTIAPAAGGLGVQDFPGGAGARFKDAPGVGAAREVLLQLEDGALALDGGERLRGAARVGQGEERAKTKEEPRSHDR
jgi:hypothetical protein